MLACTSFFSSITFNCFFASFLPLVILGPDERPPAGDFFNFPADLGVYKNEKSALALFLVDLGWEDSIKLILFELAIKLPGPLPERTNCVAMNDFALGSSTLLLSDRTLDSFNSVGFSACFIFLFSIETSRDSEGTRSLLFSADFCFLLLLYADF
jgi:hypothetical protein